MNKSGMYFVYTGNAYPHKNLNRLIQAVVLLNQNRKEKLMLKISSSRSVFTDRLKKLIENNHAQNYIELLGFVPDAEIVGLYKNSIAFVFPTLAEGFGLPPMEAINAGTLVVLSDIPVLKEVYQNSVFYFDPLDVKSIADTLEQIAKIPNSERQKKIKSSQDFVKRYSWAKMAEQTLGIYEETYEKENSNRIR